MEIKPLELRMTQIDEKKPTEKELQRASSTLLSHTFILNTDNRKCHLFATGTPKTSIQILVGKPGVFYIGASTPNNVAAVGYLELPKSIPSNEIIVIKHPHMTLSPPNEYLNPGINVGLMKGRRCPVFVTFTELTVTPRRNISLVGPVTKDYLDLTRALAITYKGESTQREPHSVIGRVFNEHRILNMFRDPKKYGLAYEKSQNILIKKLAKPCSFQVIFSRERPAEQRLLAKAYGEGVLTSKPLERDLAHEERFLERQRNILEEQYRSSMLFSWGRVPLCPTYKAPVQFSYAAIVLVTRGRIDSKIGRIPLTFSMCQRGLNEGIALWQIFRDDVSTTLVAHGYDDSDVSILGSAVSGYAGNILKPFKAWNKHSDLDCAIFSTKLACRCLEANGIVNDKIRMMGKFRVFKNINETGDSTKIGFHDLYVGQQFVKLQRKWTMILFGAPGLPKSHAESGQPELIGEDEVNFKLNIYDVPFRGNAITFHAADHSRANV